VDDAPIEKLPPHDRRRFFSAGLRRLLHPLVEQIERRLPPGVLETASSAAPRFVTTLLRPPGALTEREFLQTCHRCGQCSEVCPAHAIQLISDTSSGRHATPVIRAAEAACVLCDDLSCMKVCPSGALRLVPREAIRIGQAFWDERACVRTQGEACTICVERCPLGSAAIRLEEGRIRVIAPDDSAGPGTGRGCTGCGVCEQYCPTRPRSIRVQSDAMRSI